MKNLLDENFDAQVLRQAFGAFPSGVTAFCGMREGKPEGMAASSFTSVSLTPRWSRSASRRRRRHGRSWPSWIAWG